MPSNQIILAAGYSPEVRFVNVHKSEVIRTLFLQEYGHVNRLAVSSDSQHVAIAGNPHLRVFDMMGGPTAMATGIYEGHRSNVTAVGFEATYRWLFSGSEDGTLRIWDRRAQKCQMTYENAGQLEMIAINAMDVLPSQVEFLAGDAEGKLLLFDLMVNKVRKTFTVGEGIPIGSLSVAPSGGLVMCGTHDGTCHLWKVLPRDVFEPLPRIADHSTYVLSSQFCPEATLLATTSADGTASIWENKKQGFTKKFNLTGHTEWVWDCSFSKDGQSLLTGSTDCTCRLWDLQTGVQRAEFGGFKKGITAVALVDVAKQPSS